MLGIDETPRPGGTIQFIGGLLNWRGDDRPRAEDIKDISDYAGPIGIHHVLEITELGGAIDGWCHISRPNTSPMISRRRVFDGVAFLREATSEDRKRYDVILGFNLGTLWVRANHVFGGLLDDELQKIYRQRIGRD